MNITVFTVVDDRIELLPHFLDYYKRLGANRFVVIVTRSQDNTLWGTLASTPWAYPILMAHGHYGICDDDAEVINHTRRSFVSSDERSLSGEWHVIADLDEFHWYYGEPLDKVAAQAELFGASAVISRLVDRIAADGTFPEIPTGISALDRVFPWQCNITEVCGGNANKIGLIKAGQDIGLGHHTASGCLLAGGFETHHFKWSAGVVYRTMERHRVWKNNDRPWAAESERILDHVVSGKLVLNGLEVKPAAQLWK